MGGSEGVFFQGVQGKGCVGIHTLYKNINRFSVLILDEIICNRFLVKNKPTGQHLCMGM